MAETRSHHKIRLNKLIAESGLASRRHADQMIADGLVTVNGKRVFELGIQVDAHHDKVLVEGKPLRGISEKIYVMFHKPKGVITSMTDPFDRPTIADFLGGVPYRVFPVGRLDWDSEGLLLLTNDGDYANRIMHPKTEVTKTYLVKVEGQVSSEKIQKLLKGVSIIGGRVSARSVEKIKRGKDKNSWYKVIITEGKNRQIRQMFDKIGHGVLKLQRVGIGRLKLGTLRRGELVFLNDVAAERVFLQDVPEFLKINKTHQKYSKSPKKSFPSRLKSKQVRRLFGD